MLSRAVKEQKRQGKRVTVISGNLAPLIEHFCNELGCDMIATDMEEHGGKYNGLVCGDVCIGEEKRIRLRKLLAREGSEGPLGELVGVGNSKYDIPFLEEVRQGGGKGCVIRPSKRLKKVANAKGWNVLPVRAPGLGRLLREAVWRTSSSMEAAILLFWGGLAAFLGGGARNFKESK
jgi:phosphoserine phosphatase